jgi:hypothetical protein
MYVRLISLGTNWWVPRSSGEVTPTRRGRDLVWFNSAGLRSGRRLELCWILPGKVRFNRTTRCHPEFATRAIGRTFECDGPHLHEGFLHLLVKTPAPKCQPEAYLVTVADGTHGQIRFDLPNWRSSGVRPVSVSRRNHRFEAILLMGPDDWIRSDIGQWEVEEKGGRLVLATEQFEDFV